MLVQRADLMVLLNYIYEEDPYFEIKTKLSLNGGKDTPLARVELKESYAQVETIDESTYEDLTYKYEEFFPKYSNYLNALVASGVLKVDGIDEVFDKILGEFGKSLYDGRVKPLYVSFDTNCFINRISYQLERFAKEKRAKLGAFVVAEGIKRELFKEKPGKYREEELRVVKRIDGRFEELLNQPKVEERIKKIGKAEYDRFRSSVRFEEIPSGVGDNEIAESLGDFSRERNCDVWLMTFDKNMYEVSVGFGVYPILLEFPYRRERLKLKTDWDCVCDLIYTTAVIFGFVNISGITVYGIWRGKNPDDWNKERVKLKLNKNAKQLRMDLEVLSRIRRIVDF
jgi:hypothetical protein